MAASTTDDEAFFPEVTRPIPYTGPASDDPLSFRWYDAERMVAGRTMAEHLRFAVAWWHSLNWDGTDMFGGGTLERPWLGPAAASDPMAGARAKAAAGFELLEKLGAPFFCFHDRDLVAEADTFRESCARLDEIAEVVAAHMERTGVRLLWGTANLFSHARYQSGAATNPDPEVFAWAAAQVAHCLEVTHRLDGANYVLWGGREGYETLLNTDLGREQAQLARFLHLVVEHKHRIGFEGTILIEPKPFEPMKHQYDRDVATVAGFLERHGLAGEVRLNIEVNHATLAGYDIAHEVRTAFALGLFGSIDANLGDDRLGWDVDRFPSSVEQTVLALYELLRNGGFTTGGMNFDAKLRRPSIDRTDIFHAHVGAMDALARALLVAASLLETGELEQVVQQRYAGWDDGLGAAILGGEEDLASLRARVLHAAEPRLRSGRQEALENLVARHIDRAR